MFTKMNSYLKSKKKFQLLVKIYTHSKINKNSVFLNVILVYVQGLVYLCWGLLVHLYVDVREQLVEFGIHSSPYEFQYLRIGDQAWIQPHLHFSHLINR